MANLPKAGAQLELDTSQWDAAYKSALADAARLDSILKDLGGNIDIKVNIDDSELTTAVSTLSDLQEDASVKVNVDDTEIVAGIGDVEKLSEDQSVTVNVDNAELQQSLALLEQIRNLSIINIALSVPSNLSGIFESIPGFSALMQTEKAVGLLDAAVTKAIPNADVLINSLYTQGFGESREEIARVIGVLSNIGVANKDLEGTSEAVYGTLVAIEGITGEAPAMQDLINRMADLQSSGLADTFQEAGDILVAISQSGIGISGDAIGDLGEFQTSFANLGFEAQQVLDFLETGLGEGGVDNISRLTESLISFQENVGAVPETFTTALADLDKKTGSDLVAQLDLVKAGEETGANFMAAVLDSARQFAETEGVTSSQGLLTNIFGSTVGNVGASAVLALDPNAGGFEDLAGRSQDAAELVRDNWTTTFTELQRTIETELATVLDETFDLSTRLETAKEQFKVFVDELQSGESVGEAIEIAFGIEGVDTALTNIERVFGQLVISLLEIVASIQDPTGLGNADEGTRREIARLATQQLAFDIKVANPDEIDDLFFQASQRGVSTEALAASFDTAFNELIASGDFDKGIDLLDAYLSTPGTTPAIKAAFTERYIAPLNEAYDEAFAAGDFDIAKRIADAQSDPTKYTDDLLGKFGFNAAAFDEQAATFAQGMSEKIETELQTDIEAWSTKVREWATPAEEAGTAFTNLGTTTEEAMTNAAAVSALATDEMLLILKAMEDGVISAEEQVALMDAGIEESILGNTVTASFDAMGESAVKNAGVVGEAMRQVQATVQATDMALRSLFSGIMANVGSATAAIAELSAAGASAGNVVNNSTTVNVNTTNNVQSNAQAVANGYTVAAQVRGMAA